MTENREFYAATVEEAVEKAAKALGAPPEELSYEVVDSGAAGFLGIGARDARIVVQTTEPTVEPEQPAGVEQVAEDIGTTPYPDEVIEEEPLLQPSSPEEAHENLEPAPEELLREIETLVTSLVGEMGFDARVDVYDAGDVIAVDVASQETGLFIGQKGETIDALQYLVNVAAYKDRPFAKRIVLDSEGYRQRRVEALQGMAHRTARRAIRERRSVELPPMSAAERRIVHVYLKDNPKVVTASEGSGSNRRVTVSPA
jgi:spoIIIJ-associated protein